MNSDVAKASGTKKCIGNGVSDDIGVTVARKCTFVGELHATQREHTTAPSIYQETVNIEAIPHSNVHHTSPSVSA
jgi:hypothetical protein